MTTEAKPAAAARSASPPRPVLFWQLELGAVRALGCACQRCKARTLVLFHVFGSSQEWGGICGVCMVDELESRTGSPLQTFAQLHGLGEARR